VGGGAAAQSCVEALRQENRFSGKVVLVTKEKDLPYDRPKLSKALTSTAAEIRLRDPAFYQQVGIEVMTETEVVGVDTEAKRLKLRSGDSLKYDKLILATGSSPRTLGVEGKELSNIFVLRVSNVHPSDCPTKRRPSSDRRQATLTPLLALARARTWSSWEPPSSAWRSRPTSPTRPRP
jgi:NAD(P)H-nitrite reductase large subunit